MSSKAFESKLMRLKEEIAERTRADESQKRTRDEQDRAEGFEKAKKLDEIERSTRETLETARRVFGADAKFVAARKTGKRTRMGLQRGRSTLVVQIDRAALVVEVGAQEPSKKGRPSAPPYIGRDVDPRAVSESVIQDVVLAFLRGEPAPIRINWP